jgi:hypothetical protein
MAVSCTSDEEGEIPASGCDDFSDGVLFVALAETVMDHEKGGVSIQCGEFTQISNQEHREIAKQFGARAISDHGIEVPWSGYDSECLARFGDSTYLVAVLSDRTCISVQRIGGFPLEVNDGKLGAFL